jgi:hypothetical protein
MMMILYWDGQTRNDMPPPPNNGPEYGRLQAWWQAILNGSVWILGVASAWVVAYLVGSIFWKAFQYFWRAPR